MEMMGFQALRSSQFTGRNVSHDPGGTERSKERRPAVQPPAWCLVTLSGLLSEPLFCSPLSSLFSFSSNIQRNSEKLGRSSGSLAVFPWSGWSFHWQDVLKPCIEPSLGVF